MYLEKNQIGVFEGTRKINAQGQDLESFLEAYDPKKYDNPCNTVDTLVFTYDKEKKTVKKLLLIRRGNHPSIGKWALPGGFVEYREDLDKAALRELQEETGVTDIEVMQLKSYGAYDRDPRTRIITTAYAALVEEGSVRAQAGDDAEDSGWFRVEDDFDGNVSVQDGIVTEIHNVSLIQDAPSTLQLHSVIEVTYRKDAILQEKTYRVTASDLVAADHGAIILEGYHFVKDKLNGVRV